LVLARNSKGVNLPLEGIEELTVPFTDMWLMGRASPSVTTYSVCCFHPHTNLMEFDLVEALKKNQSQYEFLRNQGRGTDTEFTDQGYMYLPLKDK
jgi:hypothetical protein